MNLKKKFGGDIPINLEKITNEELLELFCNDDLHPDSHKKVEDLILARMIPMIENMTQEEYNSLAAELVLTLIKNTKEKERSAKSIYFGTENLCLNDIIEKIIKKEEMGIKHVKLHKETQERIKTLKKS